MIVKDERSYLVTTRVDLAGFFGEEAWVELKETDTFDAMKMQKVAKEGDGEKSVKMFAEVLPRVVIGHNFFKSETELLEPAAVVALLAKKPAAFAHVVQSYIDKVLFFQGQESDAKSKASPSASSEA